MKLFIRLMPFILLGLLIGLFWRQLHNNSTHELPSTLINEDVPRFNLSTLNQSETTFNNGQLIGGPKLLVFWATWCEACLQEHEMLNEISQTHHIPIYGILYKDESKTASTYLAEHGNPYTLIGMDNDGQAAIDFGVYGTPETYVINQGKIIYRHIGIITEEVWLATLLPLIKKASA